MTKIHGWQAHEGIVRAVALSPDESLVVSGSEDKFAVLATFPHGAPVDRLRHWGAVLAVAFDTEGTRLATGSWDAGRVRMWTLEGNDSGGSSHVLFSRQAPWMSFGGHGDATAVAFEANGSLLAGFRDGTVIRWTVRPTERWVSGDTSRAFADQELQVGGHTFATVEPGVSTSGGIRVEGTEDGRLRVVEASSGKVLRDVQAHIGPVSRAIFLAGADTVASSGEDSSVVLWNTRDWSRRHQLDCPADGVVNVASSPRGDRVATLSGSGSGRLRLWDVDTGVLLLALDPQRGRKGATELRFTADGLELLVLWPDGVLVLEIGPPVKEATFTGLDQETNLRVCRDDSTVRAVVPFPMTSSAWEAGCGESPLEGGIDEAPGASR